jgi:hypothetical protein
MDPRDPQSAERIRARIERGLQDPSLFRATLLSVEPAARDDWVDLVLRIDELPDDGPDLPRGCVPYLPCPVDALLRLVEQASVRASDIFVDIGSGLGRAGALVNLLTGASVIGLEIQRSLVFASRDLARRMPAAHISTVEGDAAQLAGVINIGSVFFLYCPFSGDRLGKLLADFEPLARTRILRICCVDLPLPRRTWLARDPQFSGDLAIYRTTLHDVDFKHSAEHGALAPNAG